MTPDNLIRRLRLKDDQIFLFLTIVIAVIAGLSAVLFTLTIQETKHLLFGLSPSTVRLILVPTLVSLLTGFLLAKYFPEARGSGVPQTKAAFHLDQGRIRPGVPFAKFLTGALCVGSGHSMGREGPSVQIGAGLARRLASGSGSRRSAFRIWFPSARPPHWPRPSTHPSPLFYSRSRKSSGT